MSRRPFQESRGIRPKILITDFLCFVCNFLSLGGPPNLHTWAALGGTRGPQAGCSFLSSWRSWGALEAPRGRQRATKTARRWKTCCLWVPFWNHFGAFRGRYDYYYFVDEFSTLVSKQFLNNFCRQRGSTLELEIDLGGSPAAKGRSSKIFVK